MKDVPLRCVVDTNVATIANGKNEGASATCVAASANALHSVMLKGHVFIDDAGYIISEYRNNLCARGQPGPGDAFFKWLLTNEWGNEKVTHVTITPRAGDSEDFLELPKPGKGIAYDRSDRKFLAVSASDPGHPPILQSFDSKWWGWRESLAELGVAIHFLCEHEIKVKHAKKMRR